MCRDVPRSESPEGARKTEAKHGHDGCNQSKQNDGFSPNHIGQSIQLETSQDHRNVGQGKLCAVHDNDGFEQLEALTINPT